jgi:carotenoid cleavage dioxygenase-like enzyme
MHTMTSHGNYHPVRYEYSANTIIEVPPTTRPIPHQLVRGTYFRNGPNPYLPPLESDHWFDGDGMIHLCHFQTPNTLIYQNSYIETHRLQQERIHHRPLFHRIGNINLWNILTYFMNRLLNNADAFIRQGDGTANTNIIGHAGKLFALHEGDCPYEMSFSADDHGLSTVGRFTAIQHHVNAHPKKDPVTGELILLGYSILTRPFCQVSILDINGDLTQTLPVSLPHPILIHDMAITTDYILIFDLPLRFNFMRLFTFRDPISFDASSPSRIGLLDRRHHTTQWYTLPTPTLFFHTANAWQDESGHVVIYAMCYDPKTFNLHRLNEQRPLLTRILIEVDTGHVTMKTALRDMPGEFPTVHPSDIGTPTRYIYYSKMVPNHGFDGIVRYDTTLETASVIQFQPNELGGEVCVAGDKAASPYLLTYVYNTERDTSELHIYDGHLMEATEPRTRVPLSHRVPFGFHGSFVRA